MREMYRGHGAFNLEHSPPVADERNHVVLHKLPITVRLTQPPEPSKGDKKWDQHHVRMPYDTRSEMKNTVIPK